MIVAGFEFVGQNRRRISIKIKSVSLSYVWYLVVLYRPL